MRNWEIRIRNEIDLFHLLLPFIQEETALEALHNAHRIHTLVKSQGSDLH